MNPVPFVQQRCTRFLTRWLGQALPQQSPCGHADPAELALRPTVVRPLRVVRFHEAGQHRASVGRMVISGRMADVCAELDRLASLQTREPAR